MGLGRTVIRLKWKLEIKLKDVSDIEEDRGQHKGNVQKGEQEGEHAQNSSSWVR